MENQMIVKDITALSPQYQEAMELHRQIMANGVMAALALVELCKNLKLMRDRRAYEHLGFDSFDDYVEQMAKIKKRQAYNYISTYERLGPEFLQSTAQLGITKLELLAQLPESTREEVMAQNDLNETSTRELKAMVDELTKAREQITWLENEKQASEESAADIDAIKKDADIVNEANEALKKKLAKLEAEKAKLEEQTRNAPGVDPKELETMIRRKIELEKDKEINEIQKLAIKDRNEAYEDGKEAVRKSLQAVEQEKANAIARAQDLEKQLKVAGNSGTVLIEYLFNEMTGGIGKLANAINKIDTAGDPDSAAKFRGAVTKYLHIAELQFGQN